MPSRSIMTCYDRSRFVLEQARLAMKTPELYAAVSKKAAVKAHVVKAVLAALKDVVGSELSHNGSAKVPTLASFRVRKVAARQEGDKKVFGELTHLSARPASNTIRAVPAQQLKDAVMR